MHLPFALIPTAHGPFPKMLLHACARGSEHVDPSSPAGGLTSPCGARPKARTQSNPEHELQPWRPASPPFSSASEAPKPQPSVSRRISLESRRTSSAWHRSRGPRDPASSSVEARTFAREIASELVKLSALLCVCAAPSPRRSAERSPQTCLSSGC